MATCEQLEIYKQRYETFRYLDRLRWQMLQIVMILGPLSLAYVKAESESVLWVFAVVGVLFVISGATMFKIKHGVDMNNKVLREVASKIGDNNIPPKSKLWFSFGFIVPLTLILLGVIFIIIYYSPS